MKKLQKNMMTLFFSILILFALAACSNGSGNNETQGEDGKVTLSFMNNWSIESPEFDIYQERIEEFQTEFPDIVIEQDKVPAGDYMTKLRTLATGKNLPDLSVVWPGVELEPLVEGGVVQPLDDISSHWESMISPQYLEGYQIDGKSYAVPTKVNSMSIIYYNKEYLDSVGYSEFPETYSEFLELVKDLKDNDITPMSVGNKPQWPLQSSYISTIADRITGSDFLERVMNGEGEFTEEGFVEALGVIEELVSLDAFNQDINSIDPVQNQDNFLQGNSAMIMTSSSANARLRIDNPNRDNIGVALFPEIEGGEGNALASPTVIQYGVAMNSSLEGEKKEAAEEFLKYFFSEELYLSLAEIGIAVPATVDGEGDIDETIVELLELMSHGATPVYDSVISPEVKASLENGLQAITTGQSTAEEVAEDMQDVLENNR